MSKVSIVHIITQQSPETGPSVFAKHEDVPGVIFCFNNIKIQSSKGGQFISDISVLAENSDIHPDIERKAESMIDNVFAEALKKINEL